MALFTEIIIIVKDNTDKNKKFKSSLVENFKWSHLQAGNRSRRLF